jgi:hypothetical protein
MHRAVKAGSEPQRRRVRTVAALPIAVTLLAARAGAPAWAAPLEPGSYRLEMSFASSAALPLLGRVRSATVSTSLAEIREHDGALEQTHRVCDARFEGAVPGTSVEMPPEFVRALATPSYPVSLAEEGSAWAYRADLGVEAVGWREAEGTPLPRNLDDPAIFDWDGDGEPAATLRVRVAGLPAGEVYVVQRARSVLAGRVVSSGRVEGGIEIPLFEQAVVGARPGFLRWSPDPTPDPEHSRFVLERVAAGTTCADLVPGGSAR